jgi:glycosyltransferase involved in cell wall biosynthesis
MNDDAPIELSVVIPCLNEADSLPTCLEKVQRVFRERGWRAEVLVADNGSSDASREIAARMGARVVPVEERGYGNALMGGIAAARGRFVLMADADDSYDFLEMPAFLERLRAGYDLVQGCRLPSGGGRVAPGAMPFSHRWIGNPMFSWLARWWFRVPIHDIYCGMRAFTRALAERLDQRCTGMEFATEMIIKASLHGARIAEVPITLHPDRRVAHAPHLRTLRDGWRTLRFFMMYTPRWLFLVPGLGLVLLGLLGYLVALPGVRIGRVAFDAHTLIFASLALICGYQAILFAIFTKTFAMNEGLLPADPLTLRFFRVVNLERGIVVGLTACFLGAGLLLWAVNLWRREDFGRLDYAVTMRWVIPGATALALGFQTVLSGFFVSILGMQRR